MFLRMVMLIVVEDGVFLMKLPNACRIDFAVDDVAYLALYPSEW